MLYKVFIDDSGLKEYLDPYIEKYIENPLPFEGNEMYWRSNYFVLTGVKIKQEDLGEIDKEFRELKQNCFGTDNIEIKSSWLRQPEKRTQKYLEPYNLSCNKLNKFGEDYFDTIAKFEKKLKIIAVVVDKRYFKHRDKVGNAPLLRATQVLLERVHDSGGFNTLVFDQMDKSTSKWKGDNGKVLGVYLTNEHMEKIYTAQYTNIVDCTFGDSKKDNILQIADICSYCVYRQFVMYGPDWSQQRGNEQLSIYPYFGKIADNFYRSPYHKNKVIGYGLSAIPNPKKLNWQFIKEHLEK